MIDDYCEEHGSQGVIEAVNTIMKDGILIDAVAYKSHDRGWVFGKRSEVPLKSTDLTKPESIDSLLRDTESHYV